MNTLERLQNEIHAKFLLYQDLSHWLDQEQTILLAPRLEVERLWELAGKKRTTGQKIEKRRDKILTILAEAGLAPDFSPEAFSLTGLLAALSADQAGQLSVPCTALSNLKQLIARQARENTAFVQEHLDIAEEMIGLMTRSALDPGHYQSGYQPQNSRPVNCFLDKEV